MTTSTPPVEAETIERLIEAAIDKAVEVTDWLLSNFLAARGESGRECEARRLRENIIESVKETLLSAIPAARESGVREGIERAARVAQHFADNAYDEGLSEDIVMARSYTAYDVSTAILSLLENNYAD